ncbi:hypothetical protein AGMMS49928_09950 [Spirochaetia bacterium]|nr:hypothetical protein AGMMS49928_09950 [Spirochaetia bacterium]
MKRIIPFSKYFLPAAIFSGALAIFGIVGYIAQGFNLGVDFQAGLIQEVQFAPPAFRLTYVGPGSASFSMNRSGLSIVISGSGVEGTTYEFPFAAYQTVEALVSALPNVQGLNARAIGSGIRTEYLVQSAQGNPLLSADPYTVHYLPPRRRSGVH